MTVILEYDDGRKRWEPSKILSRKNMTLESHGPVVQENLRSRIPVHVCVPRDHADEDSEIQESKKARRLWGSCGNGEARRRSTDMEGLEFLLDLVDRYWIYNFRMLICSQAVLICCIFRASFNPL